MSNNKITRPISSGIFEAKNCTYIVERVTNEISRVIKEGQTSFNILGKVILEEENGVSRLIIFTDVDAVSAIGVVTPKYIETAGTFNLEQLNNLPELIIEAEKSNVAIEKVEKQLPSIQIKERIPLKNIKLATFSSENSGFQVKEDPSGLGIDIVEISSTDIIYSEEIHHKVADAILIEYDDGTKYVVGADDCGRPVYMSKAIKKQITFELKAIAGAEEVGLLN